MEIMDPAISGIEQKAFEKNEWIIIKKNGINEEKPNIHFCRIRALLLLLPKRLPDTYDICLSILNISHVAYIQELLLLLQ